LVSAKEKLDQKIQDFQSGKYTFTFAEFGCRRRLSREWEDEVVRRFVTEMWDVGKAEWKEDILFANRSMSAILDRQTP